MISEVSWRRRAHPSSVAGDSIYVGSMMQVWSDESEPETSSLLADYHRGQEGLSLIWQRCLRGDTFIFCPNTSPTRGLTTGETPTICALFLTSPLMKIFRILPIFYSSSSTIYYGTPTTLIIVGIKDIGNTLAVVLCSYILRNFAVVLCSIV